MTRSVRIIGWSTALFSIVIILSDIVSVMTDPMDQLNMVFNMFPQAKSGTDGIRQLFQYSRMWSIYSILYFTYVFIGSVQFIRFKAIGRLMLETACWIGLMNACVDTCISYLLMKRMQEALSAVTGIMGMGARNFNPFGLVAIVLGFILWIVPTIGMIVYLRRPALKILMK
jgi:hypothetical protein